MGLNDISSRVQGTNGNNGIASNIDTSTTQALKEAEDNANAQSGASQAMSTLTNAIIANQLAHSINKAIISNTKTVAQQYLSIA